MARGRHGFITRGGRQVRETRWLDIDPTAATIAAGGAVITHSLTAVELALRPFTIVRTRGLLWTRSDQAAATELYVMSMGICVVSDQAAGIGVTAVPTPEDDRSSDLWFVYESLMNEFVFVSATGFQAGGVGTSTKFDSKAMRKVEDGQDVVVVVESDVLSASGQIIIVSGRMLIKLH